MLSISSGRVVDYHFTTLMLASMPGASTISIWNSSIKKSLVVTSPVFADGLIHFYIQYKHPTLPWKSGVIKSPVLFVSDFL